MNTKKSSKTHSKSDGVWIWILVAAVITLIVFCMAAWLIYSTYISKSANRYNPCPPRQGYGYHGNPYGLTQEQINKAKTCSVIDGNTY